MYMEKHMFNRKYKTISNRNDRVEIPRECGIKDL